MILAFAFTAGYLAFRDRMDNRLRAINETIGVYESCSRLRLGMSREDVLRMMGAAPKRELQSVGPAGGPAVALLFPAPLESERYPLVTLERDRMIDAYCTEGLRLTATPEEVSEMFARVEAEQNVIRTDTTRR